MKNPYEGKQKEELLNPHLQEKANELLEKLRKILLDDMIDYRFADNVVRYPLRDEEIDTIKGVLSELEEWGSNNGVTVEVIDLNLQLTLTRINKEI